jgi:glucose-6-phosphate isomerase/transaldolase/glucose-6-phosphate isomerase
MKGHVEMTALDRLLDLNAPARLRERDASLFSDDAAVQAEITANLGWTTLADEATMQLTRLHSLVDEITTDGLTDIVLLGMGGSSLASLVFSQVITPARTHPRIHVLDTTSPPTVLEHLISLDFETTLFVVSSKSGSTIEPLSLYSVFRSYVDIALGRAGAGTRFVAVTDPGSALESLAHEEGFRAVLSSPSTVGGRYSALSVFGLLPAALLGIDVEVVLARAQHMEDLCALPADANPGALLAAFAADAHAAGKDKLTLISSPGLESFGLWAEQLVAESLGKAGKGILPVVELSTDRPMGYDGDRALVIVRLKDDERLQQWANQWASHHPVMDLVLSDSSDLGAEFVRWEHAVAFLGPLLGVNPFGQPDVATAKAATARVLSGEIAMSTATGTTTDCAAVYTFAGGLDAPNHQEASIGTVLGHAVAALRPSDFLAVLAYLPYDDELLTPLREIVPPVSASLGVPLTLEIGPRYLHSTGQYHKGGPDCGVFVMVTTNDVTDVPVPGRPWGLRKLHCAQAEGDLVTLAQADRRVVRLDLPDATAKSIGALVRGLADAAGVVYEEK